MRWLAAEAASPGNPALSQFIIATGSALTVALLLWLIRILRKYATEHDWLMQQTKMNAEQTKANTDAIRTMLENNRHNGRRRQ